MTIDPGTKHVTEPWTACRDERDIPEWIAKAYIDSYRGPHADESGQSEAAETVNRDLPASLVTPAMLSAHYRLASTVQPATAVLASTRQTIPPVSARRCRWSPTTAAC